MPFNRVRGPGRWPRLRPHQTPLATPGPPTVVDPLGDVPQVHASPQAAPDLGPVTGPEVLSMAEFRRRFEAGALSLELHATFCVEDQNLTAGIQDPCGPEYAELVMETWHALSGRSRYRADEDETFELDDADYLARPWPFCSSDHEEVARYLGAVAAIIGRVGAKPPACIVEFGAGWGHLSLDLAATGFRVSAIDLNPASVALLRRRASLLGVDLDVVETSFLDFEPHGPVDVFIFFESFHHCQEPFRLLDRCTRQLAIGGRILFAADAIYDNFHAPWGVRLDGSAAFMAATHGWLELGFSRPFLEEELRKRGFDVTWEVRPELGAYGTFLTATRNVTLCRRTTREPRPIHPQPTSTTPRACEQSRTRPGRPAGRGFRAGPTTTKASRSLMPVLCACSDPRYGQNVQCNPERSVDAGGFRPPGPHSKTQLTDSPPATSEDEFGSMAIRVTMTLRRAGSWNTLPL